MAAQPALVSASAYLKGELESQVRHEFVDGSVYAMSGASRNHVLLTRNLTGILFRELTEPCQNLDQDVKVSIAQAGAYYYADATISCPPNFIDDKNGVIDNPRIIFEILLPSTKNIDRGPKFAHYRTLESLREYVLIESNSASIEVYSLQDDHWMVRFFSGLEAVAEFASLDLSLSLGELYKHAVFTED